MAAPGVQDSDVGIEEVDLTVLIREVGWGKKQIKFCVISKCVHFTQKVKEAMGEYV